LIFRHLLEKHGLEEQIFKTVKTLLAAGRDDTPKYDRGCHLDLGAPVNQEQGWKE
jgi:hypothetical protein